MDTRHKHLRRVPIRLPLDVTVIYYVTCCTFNRRPVFSGEARVELALHELKKTRSLLGWQVGGVVVMPDHVHLFCAPPEREECLLSRFMGAWRSSVSRNLHAAGVTNPIWQRGFFDHILRSGESYRNKWEYVQRNPERAGLADCRRWFEIDHLDRHS
jgi:putative transposase